VADDFTDYAKELAGDLTAKMIRCEVDFTNDSFSKKVRNAITKKVPNVWIVGANEVKDGTITWRRYAVEKQAQFPKLKAAEILEKIVRLRIMDNFADVELPAAE
jgi:threonyl-tRNA synthetase